MTPYKMRRVTSSMRAESALIKVQGGWGRGTRWDLVLECGHELKRHGRGNGTQDPPTKARCEACGAEETKR